MAEDVDTRLERVIGELLDARAVGDDEWRDLMPAARAAAGRLAAAGEVEVTQKGVVVDVATARGPVRVRRPRAD